MSDSEIIIKSLQKAERRLRTNRLFTDLTFILSLFLLFPIAFKIWDLFSPIRGRTVAVVLLVWLSSLILYSLGRIRQARSLEQTAVHLDKKAGLRDELKTAYWFITNPRTSTWVELQLRRASKTVSALSIDRLYPRVIPTSFYLAGVLLAFAIGLNFLPLSLNHNWVYLQAAPAFSLTDDQRNLLEQVQQLVKETDRLNKTDLAAGIDGIVQGLQEGRMDTAEALEELNKIQKSLETPALDTAAIEKKLNEIAEDFENAEELKNAAEELQARNLAQMITTIKRAAEDLQATADKLKGLDQKAAAKALEDAKYLEELSEKVQDQEAKDQAARNLQDLAQSLQTPSEPGEMKGEPEPGEEGSGDQEAENAQEGSGSGGGAPEDSLGRPPKNTPDENFPTQKLDVQLQQERLTGQHDEMKNAGEIEETSKQERSKLDYRNVRSELSVSERDVLNQQPIPWEYRSLIKNYFAAIKPGKNN